MNLIYYVTLVPLAVSLFITFAIILLGRTHSIGMDHPDDRRMHSDPTPRLGGISIALGLLLAVPFLPLDSRITGYMLGAGVMFAVGLIDDLHGLRWKVKMLASMTAITVLIFYSGIRIESLGHIFGHKEVHLGILSVPFTFFAIIGVVNAINMIDGLNGLASGISIIAFLFLAYFSYVAGDMPLFFLSMALGAAVTGFMVFNFPKGDIFLGDSGSMLIGFSIAVISVLLFQSGTTRMEPITPVLIMAIPVYDTLRVIIVRMLKRRNPFHADQEHLHHILVIYCGLSKNSVTLLLWAMSAAFGALAIILNDGATLLVTLLFSYALITAIFFAIMRHMKQSKKSWPARDAMDTK